MVSLNVTRSLLFPYWLKTSLGFFLQRASKGHLPSLSQHAGALQAAFSLHALAWVSLVRTLRTSNLGRKGEARFPHWFFWRHCRAVDLPPVKKNTRASVSKQAFHKLPP